MRGISVGCQPLVREQMFCNDRNLQRKIDGNRDVKKPFMGATGKLRPSRDKVFGNQTPSPLPQLSQVCTVFGEVFNSAK